MCVVYALVGDKKLGGSKGHGKAGFTGAFPLGVPSDHCVDPSGLLRVNTINDVAGVTLGGLLLFSRGTVINPKRQAGSLMWGSLYIILLAVNQLLLCNLTKYIWKFCSQLLLLLLVLVHRRL